MGMSLSEFADAINNAPTMMVIDGHGIARDVLVKPAVYGTDRYGYEEVRYYYYRGWLEPGRWKLTVVERGSTEDRRFDGFRDIDPVYIRKESVFKGHINGAGGSSIVPYLTEYDFMEPEEMPPWMAMLWVKFQEMEMREGKIPDEEEGSLSERLRRLRERLGDEKEVLKEVDPPGFAGLREALKRAEKREREKGEGGDP